MLLALSQNHKPLRPLSELYDVVGPAPARGEPLEIHSTPFGNEVFLNSVSTGAVCGAAGRRPALLLTDAATALGSEGAPAFTSKQLIGIVVCSVSWWRGEWAGLTLVAPPSCRANHHSISKQLIGIVVCSVSWWRGEWAGLTLVAPPSCRANHHSISKQLIGIVVCSVSWWRGEWVGLTLVAPLRAVLAAKLRLNDAVKEPPPPAKHLKILESIDSSLVLVRCGAAWGAGVYLGGGYVVTCAHVVRNYSSAKVSLYARGVKETAIVRYKTADDKAYDLALLFSNPENWTHLVPAHFSTETIKKGEPVLAAGFPFFNENNLEDLRPTVTSGHANNVSPSMIQTSCCVQSGFSGHANNVSPSMIQTSCCVQSGFSGGAIYRITASSRVEVLGIIVCNAKTETGACFPYINMAVPAATFVHLLHTYMHDKDADKLKCIESDKEIIQSQWRLMPYRSKI
ncbi:unnamed protein product [Plutella xylostella]|uniref:Peroxisomal leader peptide-processing protease n=1 Tax=Plutella xylostella TaxID=51655 RepID=A0A8S4G8L2_PLUXY|nr:unnamed protein product [Plutella xylostella]